ANNTTSMDFNVTTAFPWEMDNATSEHPRGAEVTVTIYVKGGELDRSTILHIGPNDVYTTERTVMEAIYLSESMFRLTGTARAAPMADDDKERLKREMMERRGK
ncbi:MAG: hypothetical protein JRJ84_13640, partial [Deltaproteobacteria bacterium]|nr:hypothetical protein [Deltaproteobacteria bacterium]